MRRPAAARRTRTRPGVLTAVRIAAPVAVALVGLAACGPGSPDAPPVTTNPVTTNPVTTNPVTVTTAGAAASAAKAAPTTPADTATTSTTVAPPAITWQDCGEDLECGTLPVPLDHADPAKGTIGLHVERRPAGDEDERIGSLLVNPGGPGVAGTALVRQASFYFSDDLRDRFDIVGWDPRGTGASSPLDCTDDLDAALVAPDNTPDTLEEAQAVADAGARFRAGCQARSGALVPYVSTQATARDMDVLRQALGEARVSYFGFSYGSELGATWATLFPGTVRAAVFDGALNPNDSWEAKQTAQAVGLERALTAAMTSCAEDPGCDFYNDGDPMGAYDALAGQLDAAPLAVDGGRPPANGSLLFYAVASSLYTSERWGDMYEALADAQRGDGRGLYALYDAYVERQRNGSFSNTIEAFLAISCLDDPGPPASEFAAVDARIRAAAPRMGVAASVLYQCLDWPGDVPHLRVTAEGASTPLLVGTTGDAITPYTSTEALAADLGARLLTVEAAQHGGYVANDCAVEAVDRYLIDRTLPAEGTTCRA